MSDAVIITLIVCVTAVLISLAVVVGVARGGSVVAHPFRHPPVPPMNHDIVHEQEGEEEVVEQPIPFDPENPPSKRIYTPGEGSPTRRCHCHGDPLVYGQEVIWWPQPGSEAVLLFCEKAIPKASA